MSDTAQDQRGSAHHNVNLSPAVPDDEFPLTESDLDGMTDAETEGLKDWLNPPEDGAGDGAEGQQAGDAASVPADSADADGGPASTAQPEPAPTVAQPQPQEQNVEIDLTPQITAKRADLDKARADQDALFQEWNDGEIAEDDFNTRRADLNQQVINLSSEIGSMTGMQSALSETKAAQERAVKEADDQQWQTTTQAFQAKNPEFWDKDHYDAFDATVRSVTSNPAVAALPFEKQLEYAAEQYVSLQRALGKPVPTLNGAAPAADPQPDADPKPDPRTAAPRTPPQTLAQVPNAAADPHQSQYAALAQKISMTEDPDERERLVGQIPDDQFDEVASLIA